MDTRQTSALNDMNKQIEDLRASQTQQSEEIRKDLGGEISALRDIIEKYFANSPSFNQREGKQGETSSDLTAAETDRRPVPPDRFSPDQISLKQGSDSIDVYLEKFDSAMTRLTLAPDHALSIFLTNMNQHLALHVRQFNVTTVPAAARIAKLHELSLQHTPVRTPSPTFNSSQRSNFSQPNKNQFSISTPSTTNIAGNQNNKPLLSNTPQKRVSLEEMQERKRKGLCMFCEEPFTPGHQLKHRRSEFLFLEADPTEFDEEIALKEQLRETTINDQDVKVPSISIHALNGSSTFNCMRLLGLYGKRKLKILIDPGSTHNFLDLQIAKGLGCYLKPIKPASVVAAGGDLITQYKGSLNKQIFQEPQIAMLHLRVIDKTIPPQQPPPGHMPYLLGKSSSPATDRSLQKLKFCPNLPYSTLTLPHYLNEVGTRKEPAQIYQNFIAEFPHFQISILEDKYDLKEGVL
ncbi:hypothetical protein IGI04_031052 [Brassica rapa subsp. trilocularis]|uniref:Retrotransposon gag domain-containing protein n=1 Tax=Brassica rapa subsp. trilocularis TaxID=1813537 RepID=A0ABQ7LWG2_BRACM|nr:hypothetical protein IGI04_031052 [Brassica rapa subsp. trilocularis]